LKFLFTLQTSEIIEKELSESTTEKEVISQAKESVINTSE
jgi:hypothetical protein